MERSKRDLEAQVASQKEQLGRYEKRLKDVVTAYKGLLKEKEALETSLSALTLKKDEHSSSPKHSHENANDDSTNDENADKSSSSSAASGAESNEDKSHLQTQIITLMNSLATLSAEKSRMEASFQADKKQLRQQMSQKDQQTAELRDKMRENELLAKASVDDIKSKWLNERQEREKETNNQMIMIRELQKLYADERHLKDNIEMQLNNFKTQFANSEGDTRVKETQALKEAKTQVKQLQTQLSSLQGSPEASNSSLVLKQLQQEMQLLKEQHAVALKNEQNRVSAAEEQQKRQAALHENRVANLEARLAELSNTVGSYDRARQKDQHSIQALKKQLQDLELNANTDNSSDIAAATMEQRFARAKRLSQAGMDLPSLVDEIMKLRKMLINENSKALHPVDLNKIFVVGADHSHCQEELTRLQQQYDAAKLENTQLQEKLQIQKTHIATLQDKVKVLNRNIDEQELELKQQAEKLRSCAKEERDKWKILINDMENETRCKINELEQQLQKQRQRSLQLLDEKEQEIKTLQTSFEVFHSVAMPLSSTAATASQLNNNLKDSELANNNTTTTSSDGESNDGASALPARRKSSIKAKKLSLGENCHMLHYANEIARKDIEVAGLRKSKYAAETSLRKAIHEKVQAQQELADKIEALEEQVDRLERCKTREGANLEYLKNVIISYMTTRDPDGKRHMMNAISAVLQFTHSEIQVINSTFQK